MKKILNKLLKFFDFENVTKLAAPIIFGTLTGFFIALIYNALIN